MSRNTVIWGIWLLVTLIAILTVATWMTVGGNRELLLVGKTTDAHHQIEMACETCHAAPIFSGTKAAVKAMNKTCRNCHEGELAKADDSHPRKKFRSPRMADYWEKLDARLCTSCHIEHRLEITRESAVTVAMNFCVACHSEGDQDVRLVRTSHSGLAFDTCATAGCHNYHDNRALYGDFLVKHAQEDWLAQSPVHKLSALFHVRENSEGKRLMQSDAVAPSASLADETALSDWASSGHARTGINCANCHAPDVADESEKAEIEANWINRPNMSVCVDCHKGETKTFRQGRHGMRQHPKIAKLRDTDSKLKSVGLERFTPEMLKAWISDPTRPLHMTVAESRLPMRKEATGKSLDCGTCHNPHTVDVKHAAVEACLTCHNDSHSQAYRDSVHHLLWKSEGTGEAAPGTGVSCATCHMVKIKQRGKIATNHNQNDTLRPNEKMIRPVCLDCHGLSFTLDSLADDDLITRNFHGKPSVHVESIKWALHSELEGDESTNR